MAKKIEYLKFKIVGTITDASGSPTEGLVIKAYDRKMRKEVLIGTATTNELGQYTITYPPEGKKQVEELAQNEKGFFDFVVKVYSRSGRKLLYAPSLNDIQFNELYGATTESFKSTIDIQLDVHIKPSKIEYTVVSDCITSLADEVPLSNLKENQEFRDITFLTKETGLNPSKLHHMGMAHQLYEETKVSAEFFYGILRTDIVLSNDLTKPSEIRLEVNVGTKLLPLLYDIVLTPAEELSKGINKAVSSRIVPRSVKKEFHGTLRKLDNYKKDALNFQENIKPNQTFDFIESLLTPENIQNMLDEWDTSGGDIQTFLEQAGQNGFLNPASGNGKKTYTRLSKVVDMDGALLKEIKRVKKITTEEGTKQLAKMNKKEMAGFLKASAKKIKLGGEPLDPKLIDRQSSILVRKLERAYPTSAFSAQLKRDQRPLSKKPDDLVKFFEKHPDFDLQKTPIENYFRDNKSLNVTTNETLKNDLKARQRIFRLIPNYSKTKGLVSQNIQSAQSIVAAGLTNFAQRIGPEAGLTGKEAISVFKKAESKHAAAMFMAGEVQSYAQSASISALTPGTVKGKLDAVGEDFPNLKILFKLTDLCACEHCRSVYSPAAYLVELLEFLDKRTVVDTDMGAQDLLFERRPDLGDIDLSCANANTPVPYIDLVCELLEEEVAPNAGVDWSDQPVEGPAPADLIALLIAEGYPVTDKAVIHSHLKGLFTHYVLRDEKAVFKMVEEPAGSGDYKVILMRQTYGTAEELAAAPEYVNTVAYDVVSTSGFAFTLPFDLNHAEASAYFQRFGIQRWQLMQDLDANVNHTMIEFLGLTASEYNIITIPGSANQGSYWNFPAADVVAEMTVVDTFLTKTKLTYEELVILLQMSFINPNGKLFIQHKGNNCDTTLKTIDGLDENVLDRIHRFLRLMKKTAWKMTELNEVIMQPKLGNGLLDNQALLAMKRLQEIKQICGMKINELLGCFGDIPHTVFNGVEKATLYNSIFQNKATDIEIDEGLAAENIIYRADVGPASAPDLLSNHRTSLSLALKISEEEFDQLIDPVTALLPDYILVFENLSFLYAVTLMCKKLVLSISDYLLLRKMTSNTIFSEINDQTLTFMDLIKKAAQGPFPITDVKYILWHEAENLGDREMDVDKITELLEALQTDYLAAYEEHRSPYNSSIPWEELKGPMKDRLLALPTITEATANDLLSIIEGDWASVKPKEKKTYINELLGEYFDTTDFDLESSRQSLVENLFDALSKFFYESARDEALVGHVATTFAVEEELVDIVLGHAILKQQAPYTNLIQDLLQSDNLIGLSNQPTGLPEISLSGFPDIYAAVRALHKMFPVVLALELKTEALEHLLSQNVSGRMSIDGLPFSSLQTKMPYSHWQELLDFIAVLNDLTPVVNPADAETPITIYSLMDQIDEGANGDIILNTIAQLTSYDRGLLQEVNDHFRFSNSYKMAGTWEILHTSMGYLRKLGTSLIDTLEFIEDRLTANDTGALRLALKARYSDSLWLTTLGEIMDKVRPQKRDALVAYLLATNPELKDTNGLYDKFLVDVEMEACMPSSRIVQAHGTIQLFVQRCQLGLEPTATADVTNDIGWKQWEWMRLYRVWEANRKIFLYPENWIEPELLDHKSSLFSDLENELLQNEVNEDTTEEAIISYLEKLDDIAYLEVVAQYYQDTNYTMHVIGRTKGGEPHVYYYRTLKGERNWTPWQPVDLDITGNTVLVFVRNSRLHLAWLVISEVPDPDANLDKTSTPENVKKKLKIQIAISEFSSGSWKPKKVSIDAILTPNEYTLDEDGTELDRDKFNMVYDQFRDHIYVFHTDRELVDYEYPIHKRDGIFDIAGCKGYPELKASGVVPLPDFFPDFKDGLLRMSRYFEQDKDARFGLNDPSLSVRNVFSFFEFIPLLLTTPEPFRITFPHQITLLDIFGFLYEIIMQAILTTPTSMPQRQVPFGTLLPYFFEDTIHAYTITPGFYGIEEDDDKKLVGIRRTGSDVLKLVDDIIALLKKYILLWIAESVKATPDYEGVKIDFWSDDDTTDILSEFNVYKSLRYGEQFKNNYHSLLCHLRTTLFNDGVSGLMERKTQLHNTGFNFITHYLPNLFAVPLPTPLEDLDFDSDGSYSSYNWELFYHIPMMIANRLSKDQRFEEATTWFHYMFNPTGALSGPSPQKYWVTKPFYQHTDADYTAQRIDQLMYDVATNASHIAELKSSIEEWRENPFMPHVVARFRPVAYQKALLMKYIDNLLEWGDNQFRMDTMESIVQATQLYILADKLLGTKPRVIGPAVKPPYQTYNQLESSLDNFGNAMVEFENLIPEELQITDGAGLPAPMATLTSLYFCIPQNDKLLDYWDKIEDRLFKIRNCQNIDGVERALALFSPPIDPAALVKAAAGGLSISSILAGLSAPLPHYRFNALAGKATELIQEVRSLGNSLLQALEKKDGEALALLQNELELKVLKSVRKLKELQIEEANEQLSSIDSSKAITKEKKKYYANIKRKNDNEQLNLDKMKKAHGLQKFAQLVKLGMSATALIPELDMGASGWAGTPVFKARYGGSNLSRAADGAAGVLSFLSMMASNEASRAAQKGTYDRRWDDWKFQERMADKELKQIDQQRVAAEVRLDISEADLKNHDIQIENSKRTNDFMRSKYTNKELHQWMIGQISSVYFSAYKLAYDTAKKAEICYKHELGSTETFLEFGYWDSMKKGLLAADHLFHDLKQMEVRYLDQNKRDYELTKHISLAQLDPYALELLKITGECFFEIPEAIYDMDHSGHYFRRIKSVSISLPCVVGPYTSVSGKLSQLSNKYRKNTSKNQEGDSDLTNYREMPEGDPRFIYNVGNIQSVATSGAQNDSGLFEFNFRDERYLPFEGTGAIGSWRFELPKQLQQFDYNTIADLVVHVKYMAREGGSSLRSMAENSLEARLNEVRNELSHTGLHTSINIKHAMPDEWNKLKTGSLTTIEIDKTRLPYFVFVQEPAVTLTSVTFIARVKDSTANYTININEASDVGMTLHSGLLMYEEVNTLEFDTPFSLAINGNLNDLEELVLLVNYLFPP